MATSAARPARSKDCDIHCDALGYDFSTLTSWVGLHAVVSDHMNRRRQTAHEGAKSPQDNYRRPVMSPEPYKNP
jgi:hypothetical protein